MTAQAYYDLTAESDTCITQPGTEINVEGATYVYAKANGALAQYGLAQLTVSTAGLVEAVPATITTAGGASSVLPAVFCIPQFAVTDDYYFWAPVGPFAAKRDSSLFYVKAAVTCVSSAKLYATATAGVVDDVSTSAVQVQGLVLLTGSTDAAANCPCIASRRLTANS
jgi:hypothetical protein